jgi:hypothetical protein
MDPAVSVRVPSSPCSQACLGGRLISHRVVVAIPLRFSSSSFSSRSTTTLHQHHPHNTINMHQPSLQSSASSPASRPPRAMHHLPFVSICCAFGKSLHFTHSNVHSCLPSHAGSFDASAPQDCSRTLAVSSTSQDASVAVISETRRSHVIASPRLISSDDDHQPLCHSHGITSLLYSVELVPSRVPHAFKSIS